MSTVSVIIPTYNRRHLIGLTLDSIFNQTLAPHEVIVVDDGSTDGTQEMLEKQYIDRIIYLKNKGKGPGAARNTGLIIASGKYIQFFDSDDLMTPNKLQVQSNLLGDNSDTFVYSPYAIATAPPDNWMLLDAIIQYKPLPDGDLAKWLKRGWCSITQACLFPKQLIDQVGPWREDIFTHEDREYWIRIAQKIRKAPIHNQESLTIYRQHTSQLTLATERQLQRSSDSLIVDDILTHENCHNIMTFLLLYGRIVSTKKFINTITPKYSLTFSEQTLSIIYRLINKYERYITKNNWQRMYGASTSHSLFREYLEKI